MTAPFSVLVTGDIVIDRHIYEGDRMTLRDQSNHGTHLVEEPGGAALTHRLIEAVFAAEVAERQAIWEAQKEKTNPPPVSSVCQLGCKIPENQSPLPGWRIGTASWGMYPKSESKDLFWRLTKPFGYGSRSNDQNTDSAGVLFTTIDSPVGCDALVLDDAGDQFRNKANTAAWHLSKDENVLPRWIVLKLAGPIGRGDLWDRLMTCDPHDRLIVIVPAKLLRQDEIRLSRGLSWERTVEHLINELHQNPAMQPLRQSRHLIITFESDGGVWLNLSKPSEPAQVVFDAAHTEGEWSSRIKGHVFGYQTCLAASVVQTLATLKTRDAEPEFRSALERGLSGMRNLHHEGHGIAVTGRGLFHAGRGFPASRLATEILHPSHRFARATVPLQAANQSTWSILASLQGPTTPARPLFGFARQLAIRGDSVLDYVPHFRIGKLLAAGRDEMETLRSLRRIMVSYRDMNAGKKPLCIGVFGTPGSGKSFAVEQLACGVFGQPDKKSYDGWMEFNLSQFDSPADLIGAFHQIRDRVLQGFVPVVFWDEFDATSYKWLQFLLAPMQDGRFQESQVTHTLGKCVFIFAGGTSATFEEFGPKTEDPAFAHFKLAKGPDFKSRLDGYLNVLGPNPSGAADVSFPVRRALLIRNFLGCDKADLLDIDSGLLTALLEAPAYKHGARSLGKIIDPFVGVRKILHAPLRRSQLPAPNQLSLHTNADEFHALCARDLPFKTDEIIQKLAPAIHETWRAIAGREGRKAKYDMPFDELPPDIKRSNEAAARRIPDIISLLGLKVEPGVATESEEQAVRNQLENHLEPLAEEEHKGWLHNAESEGWRFAEARNDDKRLHDCLRPFHELRESDKEKDRNSVRHFPDFVGLAGFKIVFIGT